MIIIDDIDTLLGDMIDLGISESRVKMIIRYVFIRDEEEHILEEKLYTLEFPNLDRIIGKIGNDHILGSLENNSFNLIKNNYWHQDIFKIEYSKINQIFSNPAYAESLESFINIFTYLNNFRISVQLFIDGELIDMNNEKRIYDREIPEYGDLMLVKDFQQNVEDGIFNTFDGTGYFCKDNKMSRKDEVFSSSPLDATHICWFNK